MTEMRTYEAVWRLDDRPLTDRTLARQLFVAVGEVRRIEPARYDLNRRGRWRDYDGRRLMVDVVTQRTQLVRITEEQSVDDGGALVVVGTGKQDRPPQALARWRQPWPPPRSLVEEWKTAIGAAFDELPLDSFVLRVADDADAEPADGRVRIGASSRADDIDRLEAIVASDESLFGTEGWRGAIVVGDGGEPPDEWDRIWVRD